MPHPPSPRHPVKTPQGWVTTITTKLLTDSSHARADRWKREREGGGEEGENGENPARRTRRTALKILLHTLSSSSSLAAMVMGNESGKWEWRMGRGRGGEWHWVLATRASLEGCQLAVAPLPAHTANKKGQNAFDL